MVDCKREEEFLDVCEDLKEITACMKKDQKAVPPSEVSGSRRPNLERLCGATLFGHAQVESTLPGQREGAQASVLLQSQNRVEQQNMGGGIGEGGKGWRIGRGSYKLERRAQSL
eukprot:7027579-Pyramimonas_sp.AAC.1